MRKTELQNYIAQVETFLNAFNQLLPDMKVKEGGRKVRYFVDWDSMYAFIWRGATPCVPPAKSYGQRLTQTMIDHRHLLTEFDTAFSPYTFFEFLDSVLDHIEDLELTRRHFLQFEKNRNLICEGNLDNLTDLVTSTKIAETQLRTLRALSQRSGADPYIERAKKIFGENGIFEGIHELGIESPRFNENDMKFIDRSREEMWRIRSSHDVRADPDKLFHYLIDVLNILLNIKLSSETGDHYRLVSGLSRYNAIRNEYIRHPLVPHLWISAFALTFSTEKSARNRPKDEFPPPDILLRSARDRAELLLGDLADLRIEEGAEIPTWVRLEIFKYYSEYMDPLNNPNQTFASTIQDNEQLKEILSSRKLFEEKVEKERQKLYEAGRYLAERHSQILESDLLNIPAVDEDAIFDTLIRKFYL